jgi:large-conductance mechanosensitive channel
MFMKTPLIALTINSATVENFGIVFRSRASSYSFLGSLSREDILNIVITALVVLIIIIAIVNDMIKYVEHKVFEEE